MILVDRRYHDEQTGRVSVYRTVRARHALRFGYWKQSMEKLRKKWTVLTRDIILAIAEEEMRISREELDKQIVNRSR
jgi:hypothetical protein